MATTTDMSDNVAADAAIAEQIAVDDLLLDTSNEILAMDNIQSAMDIDQEPSVPLTETPYQTPIRTPQPVVPLAQPTITTTTTSTPPIATFIPSRVGTPSGSTHANGYGTPSRAVSVQAETPAVAQKHGAPARQYMNEKITPHVLEIFKRLAVEQPENPLRVLAEFFDQRATDLGQ